MTNSLPAALVKRSVAPTPGDLRSGVAEFVLVLLPLVVGVIAVVAAGLVTTSVALSWFGWIIAGIALPAVSFGALVSDAPGPATRLAIGVPLTTAAIFGVDVLARRLGVPVGAGVIVSAVGLALVLRRPRLHLSSTADRHVSGLFAALALVPLGLVFLCFVLPTAPPSPGVPGLYYQDSLWTLGNTASYLETGLPIENPRLAGVRFGYHIEQNVLQAVAAQVTQVGLFQLHFALEPLFTFWHLALVLFYAPRVWLQWSTRSCLLLVALGMLWAEPFGGYLATTYWNPISFLVSLPAFYSFFIALFGRLSGATKPSVAYFGFLMLGMAGAKGHLLLVVPVSVALMGLRDDQRPWHAPSHRWLLGLGGVTVLAAFVLGLTIFSAPPLHGIHGWPINHGARGARIIARVLGEGQFGQGALIAYHLLKPTVANLARFFSLTPTVGAVLVALVLRHTVPQLCQGEVPRAAVAVTMIFAVVNIVLVSTIQFFGGYSYFFAFPSALFGLLAVELLRLSRPIHLGNWPLRLLLVRMVGLLAVATGMVSFAIQLQSSRKHWASLPEDRSAVWDQRATIDADEWEAAIWLNEHLTATEVFVANRGPFRHETEGIELDRFFGFSAISGRRAWLEGGEFVEDRVTAERRLLVDSLFNAKTEEDGVRALARIPVTYVVFSRRFQANHLGRWVGDVVFENAEVVIYRVAKRPSGATAPSPEAG